MSEATQARDPGSHSTAATAGVAALTLGALGVVFGDIGTSPLYALQTVFTAHDHAVKPDAAGVYGVMSLVFWSITIIVSLKYVTFIMRAGQRRRGRHHGADRARPGRLAEAA